MKFPFNEQENVAVFTCKHILEAGADICYVSHDQEGDWQFLCGLDSHVEAEARIISLKQALDLDNSIAQLADMPIGCSVSRKTKNSSWEG